MTDEIGGQEAEAQPEGAAEATANAPDPLFETLDAGKVAAKEPSTLRAINTAKWSKGEKAMDDMVFAHKDTKDSSRDAADRARDPQTGKFVAKTEGQEAPTDEKASEEPRAPALPSPEPASPQPKIKLGAREFAAADEADRFVSTLEWHVTQASQSAEAWKAEAERLRAEVAKQSPAAPSTPDAAKPAEGIDEDLAATMWQIANEKGTPHLYFNWRAAEEAKLAESRMEKRLTELLGPTLQAAEVEQQREAWQTEVKGVFANLRQYTAPGGSPAFPEIDDPKTVYEVGQLMDQLGWDANMLKSPTGMAAAIYTYRGWKQGLTPLTATPAVAAPPPPSDANAVATGTEVPFNRADAPDGLSKEARWLRSALAQTRPARVSGAANGGRPVELGFSRR